MAKKSIVDKNNKRALKISKRFAFRSKIKNEIKAFNGDINKAFTLMKIMDGLRDSSPIRYRNRCNITGRPRGFRGGVGLSRGALRHYASFGMIVGVKKG